MPTLLFQCFSRRVLPVCCLLMGPWVKAEGEGGKTVAVEVKELAPEPRRVRQAVQEYMTVMEPAGAGAQRIEQEMNPFMAYTHLGTDFGFINHASDGVGWQVGTVKVKLGPGQWGGMWHSLAGLATDETQSMDFAAAYAPFIAPSFQPKVVGVEFRAKGRGVFKLELKGQQQELLWSKKVELDSPDMRTTVEAVEPGEIGKAKFLNWVAEPGAEAELDSLGFIVQTPEIAFDKYVFLVSYAKLARCYDEVTGLVRDRAHVAAGLFDNVPASGLFALATALAWKEGLVEEAFARRVLNRIHENVAAIETAGGWLPHFVRRNTAGRHEIVPGTEFSTVDSSLYFHAVMLAADLLGDQPVQQEVQQMVRELSLENLVDPEGYIGHGFRDGGVSKPLPSVWKDWGGETALVLALTQMTANPAAPRMADSGRVHDGVGFIVEIQSLFYPDFDSERPDLVSRQNWMGLRREMLKRQRGYFPEQWPDSRVANLGFYGLSAGEARLGLGYMVSGVDLPQQRFLHPHYVLLSACVDPSPDQVYEVLRRMEGAELFPPWGMVENFNKDLTEILPMQGALNASFESLGAYHLLARRRGGVDAVYEASQNNADMRKAAAVFYPAAPISAVESNTGMPLAKR